MPPACPVCRAEPALPFQTVGERTYWRCPSCAARFLDPGQRPGRAEEHAVYRLHRNDPDDPGYRRFLGKVATPLLARLAPGSQVLDFGCGAGSALAAMLREAGHAVALYDPAFFPDPAPLAARYDAITCTEVVEHLHDPAATFAQLDGLLTPGGWLAVMTCFQTDDARFAGWHYRQDPTHVVFYREETLRHVATAHGWTCEVPVKDVALMRKATAAAGRLPRDR